MKKKSLVGWVLSWVWKSKNTFIPFMLIKPEENRGWVKVRITIEEIQ